MLKKTFRFSTSSVDYYFAGSFSQLKEITDKNKAVIITDENVFQHHEKRFKGWNIIILKPGEEFKIQKTVDAIVDQLIEMKVDRTFTLIGIGGGVITDITGYVASIYMRGISFGFVPTTLLALVDASIGGKNGIDVGAYKNMVGVIRQPKFILHDLIFLNSLPDKEWRNGFAEVIKHACISEARMFKELEGNALSLYQKKKKLLSDLIQKNALLKTKVVQSDEFEKGDRKLLNFGHTIGHALETQYELSHGEAISIGMTAASKISAALLKFKNAEQVPELLSQYGLPTDAKWDKEKVMNILQMDKKKESDFVNFILLQKVGKAVIHPISFKELNQMI